MKKILSFIAAGLVIAVACTKEELPKAEFETNLYKVLSQSPVDVVVKMDKAAPAALSIPLSFGGSAVKGTDYTVSAESVSIEAGATSGFVTITDTGLTDDKTITLSIAGGQTYQVGTKYLTTVTLDSQESLIYSFKASKADLIESVIVTISLTGEKSGAKFKASADLDIPIKLEGDGSAYVVDPVKFTVPKGQNSASVTLTPDPAKKEALAALTADPSLTLSVNRTAASRTFLPGDIESMKVRVHCGLQLPSRLVGTWTFQKIFAQDEVEFFFEEGGDDISLLPLNNQGFTLSFTENEETGVVTLTPGGTGDFLNFFRTATVSLATPINYTAEGVPQGNYTVSELNMFIGADETDGYDSPAVFTYYKLSQANRAFDKNKVNLGEAVIAFRLNDSGKLEMMLRDYNTPPFGEMWWDPGSFDPDLFGFASLFAIANN